MAADKRSGKARSNRAGPDGKTDAKKGKAAEAEIVGKGTAPAESQAKSQTAAERIAKPSSPKTPRKRGRPPASQEAIVDQAKQSTIVVVETLNGGAAIAFGENAPMTQPERMMIEDPMMRMMERLDIDTSRMVGTATDPLMLLMGLIAWGARVWRESRKPKPGEDGTPPGPSDDKPSPDQPKEEKKIKVPSNENHKKDEKDPEKLGPIDAPNSIREGLPGHG